MKAQINHKKINRREKIMKKKLCFIMAVTLLSTAFTGCSEKKQKENLNIGNSSVTSSQIEITTPAYQQTEVIQNLAVENNNVAPVQNEAPAQTVSPVQTEAPAPVQSQAPVQEQTTPEPAKPQPDTPYPYPEDTDSSAVLSIKEDGSVRAIFGNGAVELTFPAEFINHFVIHKGTLYSKIAFTNGKEALERGGNPGGRILVIKSYDELGYLHGAEALLGWDGEKYWRRYESTDVHCNPYNAEELEEYLALIEKIDEVINTARIYSKSGEYMPCTPLPDGYIGELRKNKYNTDEPIFGYTDSYILDKGPQVKQWEMEETWHVTAKSIKYAYNQYWFDCYDTDDNDHYGWVNEKNIVFYTEEGQKHLNGFDVIHKP